MSRTSSVAGVPAVPILFGTLALVALLPLRAQSGRAAASGPTPDPTLTAADRGRIIGKESAPLWVLVVSDFQCPYCRQWHRETWDALRKEYVETGKVRVAYVNFPLGMHPNAKPAARFAMCASAQNRFWQYADRLFESQNQWKELKDPTQFFAGLAEKAKLAAPALQSCLANPSVTSLIDADYARMARAGTGSTPTFFIGNGMLEGAQPIAEFRKAINAELARVARKP